MSIKSLKICIAFSSIALCFAVTGHSQNSLKINNFLDQGVSPSAASQEQLKKAVYGVMASDLEVAPATIAETVGDLPEDRSRIDAILSASVSFLKEKAAQEAALARNGNGGDELLPIAAGPAVEYDCTKVIEIWSLAVAAAPDLDQFIIEVGMREAPECFQGALSEAITETGSIARQFNLMSIGLNGAPAETNTGTPVNPPDPRNPTPTPGPVSPFN